MLALPMSTMLSPTRFEAISRAITEGALFGGGVVRLTTPEDGWAITTGIGRAALTLFRAEARRAVVTSDVLGVHPRWVCWVFGYQVGQVQHRAFLPLVGAAVGQLIASTRTTDVRLLMDSGWPEFTLEARIPASLGLVAALQEHWQPRVEPKEAGEYMLATAARLLSPGALKPAQGSRVPKDVSVAAVIPEGLSFDDDGGAASLLQESANRYAGRR